MPLFLDEVLTARQLCLGAAVTIWLCSCSSLSGAQRPPTGQENQLAGQSVDTSADDERVLSEMTHLLGHALPSPAADDPIGVDEPAYRVTRTFIEHQLSLRDRAIIIRGTAWQDRTHTLEVTFPDGCDSQCADPLAETIDQWIGPVNKRHEGRARFVSVDLDTLRLIFEIYPERPRLTRLLLQCHPLQALANGRAIVLPKVGEKPEKQKDAQCRPVGISTAKDEG